VSDTEGFDDQQTQYDENVAGINLGYKAAINNKNIWCAKYNDHQMAFILAVTEDDACEIASQWPLDSDSLPEG
jgi:hypothetical protein